MLHLLNTSDFPASMKDELKNIGEGTHILLNFFCFQQQSCIFVKNFFAVALTRTVAEQRSFLKKRQLNQGKDPTKQFNKKSDSDMI